MKTAFAPCDCVVCNMLSAVEDFRIVSLLLCIQLLQILLNSLPAVHLKSGDILEEMDLERTCPDSSCDLCEPQVLQYLESALGEVESLTLHPDPLAPVITFPAV